MENSEIWQLCIEEACKSELHGDVPIGALLLKNNEIIAMAHNTRQRDHNILGHAEVNVILEASKQLKTWNLSGCSLFVTLKPCSMCNEIIKQSRIDEVYYLLDKLEEKKEYFKTNFQKISDKSSFTYEQMYHKVLSDFFKKKR